MISRIAPRIDRAHVRCAPDRIALPAFAVLFAYLFLVGLYESRTIPVSVTTGVLGAFLAIVIARLTLDPYAQIGMWC
jgi:multidrug efflux pump subunit AcrB